LREYGPLYPDAYVENQLKTMAGQRLPVSLACWLRFASFLEQTWRD
jgi:hypothetical protein